MTLWLNFFFFFSNYFNIVHRVVHDLKCWISSKIRLMKSKMAARRPYCFFQLTRVHNHFLLWINLVFSIWVYQYQTMYEFENHHDWIQNGRPVAILVTSAMIFRLKFFFQIILISCTVAVYDLKSLIVTKKPCNAVDNDCPAPILVASHGRILPHWGSC